MIDSRCQKCRYRASLWNRAGVTVAELNQQRKAVMLEYVRGHPAYREFAWRLVLRGIAEQMAREVYAC